MVKDFIPVNEPLFEGNEKSILKSVSIQVGFLQMDLLLNDLKTNFPLEWAENME